MRAGDHLLLARGFVDNRVMVEYYPFWILYILYTSHYIISKIRQPSFQFLTQISLFETWRKWTILLSLQLAMWIPAIAYAVMILVIALQKGSLVNVTLIAGFFTTAIVFSSLILLHQISNPFTGYTKKGTNVFRFKFTKPVWTFFLFQLIHEKASILLVTKTIALILLLGFMHMFNVGTEDSRPLMVTMLIVAGVHIQLVQEYFAFQTVQMQNFHQLPVSIFEKFMQHLFTLSILLLPEGLLILRFAPEQYGIGVRLLPYLFGISLLLAALCRLYVATSTKTYSSQLSIAGGVLFFILLFNAGPYLIPAFGLMAYFWFRNNFYNYESPQL